MQAEMGRNPGVEKNSRQREQQMRKPRGSRECGKEKEAFPGSPVVRSLGFCCREHGFNPWLGN